MLFGRVVVGATFVIFLAPKMSAVYIQKDQIQFTQMACMQSDARMVQWWFHLPANLLGFAGNLLRVLFHVSEFEKASRSCQSWVTEQCWTQKQLDSSFIRIAIRICSSRHGTHLLSKPLILERYDSLIDQFSWVLKKAGGADKQVTQCAQEDTETRDAAGQLSAFRGPSSREEEDVISNLVEDLVRVRLESDHWLLPNWHINLQWSKNCTQIQQWELVSHVRAI